MGDDIYDDLDNFERLAEYDELKEENARLHKCVRELEQKISQLTEDNAKMTERLANIERNFAALLNTAKAEINRKTEMIATLNMEKDQLIFRHIGNRNNLNRRYPSHFDRQSQPTKRKLDRSPSAEKKIPRLETQHIVRDREITSEKFEEKVEDENRIPTAIRQDNCLNKTGVSVRPDTPRFSSGDESYGSNNNHLAVSTHPWNSPEYFVPDTTKEEHVAQEMTQNIPNRRKHEELNRCTNDVDKYKKNIEHRTEHTQKEDLRNHRKSLERDDEDDCKSFKKSSREAHYRYYENTRFERIKREERIPRSKYREEPRYRYNRSRTRPRHDKFDKCRRSRSQSPSLGSGSRNDRRHSSRHSQERHAHLSDSRELRKRSFSPRRTRRRSVEKHWHEKTERRRDPSYERSHSRNHDDHVMMSPRRRAHFDHERGEAEDAKPECSREDTFYRINKRCDVNEQEKRECLNVTQTDNTAERYKRDKSAGVPIKFINEPDQPTWQAQLQNKGRCRTNSYSKFDTLHSYEMSADVRICQSPDETDEGYRGAAYDFCVIIQEKGVLTVYDDPRLYNERYFHYEDIERHKHSKHNDVKGLEKLNIRSKPVYLRLIKYEDKPKVTITQQETATCQEITIPQENLVPRNTIIPQETVIPRESIIPQELIKQQNTIISHQTIVPLEPSTKNTKTNNDISDETIKQIYMDIDRQISEASLESGELEDSFYLAEQVEKPTKFLMESQPSAPKEENIENVIPEANDKTVKHKAASGNAKTASINKSTSPVRKKMQGYKIPKLRNSKLSSGTRKVSENKCNNLSSEINRRSKLGKNNENTIPNVKNEGDKFYSNVKVDVNSEYQNEKSNTKANNILTLLARSMEQDLEEQAKSSKNPVNKVKSKIKENTIKDINKNSERCEWTNECENNSKPNKHKDSKGCKGNSKKSAKDITNIELSEENHQTDKVELVEIPGSLKVNKSHAIDKIGKEKDSCTVKQSITCDNSIKHSDCLAEDKIQIDCDDIKLSDLRKQKDLDRGKKSKDTVSKSSQNFKKESRSGRSSKTSKHIDNHVKSSNSSESPLISPIHTVPIYESSAAKTEDSKILKNTTEHTDISKKTPETPETEKKRKSNKHKSKKESKPDTTSSQPTSKSEDQHMYAQNEDVHSKVADKAKKDITNKMTDLFGENSLITPEDLQDSRNKSFQTPNYPESELDVFLDEKLENLQNTSCHPENPEQKLTIGIFTHSEHHSAALVKETIIENINTESRKKENNTETQINDINVEVEIKSPSKDNDIPEMILNAFEQASTTIPKQGQNELRNTENIAPEPIIQHNLQALTNPTLTEEILQPNLNVNKMSRDMPSILGLRDDEEKQNLNCISTGNRGNYTAELRTNFLLKGYKNSDSDTHTDSDCEPPHFSTSTPNPNMSPSYCQKVMCIHSPIKETSYTDITEKSNIVTELKEDSMQSTSSVQANVSQPQANETTVVGPPAQRLIIVRKRRRVIVKEP